MTYAPYSRYYSRYYSGTSAPTATTLTWAGYVWNVTNSAGILVAPGPNYFEETNASVVGTDLHLEITHTTRWDCAQITLADAALGYGKYTWAIDTALAGEDAHVAVGLTVFDGQDVVTAHPTIMRPGSSSVSMTWTEGMVRYELADSNGVVYFRQVITDDVAEAAEATVTMSAYLIGGTAPGDGLDRDIVFSDFTYTSQNCAYGPLRIGRLELVEYFTVEQQSGNSDVLTVAGQESAPPLALAKDVRYRGESLLAMNGQLVQAQFTAKSDRDGFYYVRHPDVQFRTDGNGDVHSVNWKCDLERVGVNLDVEAESRLVGGTRNSSYAASGATTERWHAPPIGHVGYWTGTSLPSYMSRNGEQGTMTIYRGVPATANPRWGISPVDFQVGAARIEIAGYVRTGNVAPNAPTDWVLTNGFIKIEPRDTTGTLRVSSWDATAGDWTDAKVFDIKAGSTSLGAFSYISILRNAPEEVIIRLTRVFTPGKSTVDISLRRGARFAAFYVQRVDSGTTTVLPYAVEAATNSGSGFIYATSNDSDGNRYVLGSPTTMTVNTTVGSIANAVAAIGFSFFIGIEEGGTSAISGDHAADIAAQYLGTPTEETRVLIR